MYENVIFTLLLGTTYIIKENGQYKSKKECYKINGCHKRLNKKDRTKYK